jgi:hypothetical protein
LELWRKLSQREEPLALRALEELAIHYEHRSRDTATALIFTTTAIDRIRATAPATHQLERFRKRLERLERKTAGKALSARTQTTESS